MARTRDPRSPWEGGDGDEEGGEGVGGMLGSSIPFGALRGGFAVLFTSRRGRTRHRAAADRAPVASPAASPGGFWCWARRCGGGGDPPSPPTPRSSRIQVATGPGQALNHKSPSQRTWTCRDGARWVPIASVLGCITSTHPFPAHGWKSQLGGTGGAPAARQEQPGSSALMLSCYLPI